MGTKVLIIGLDGATPELVDRWVAENKLPYLKQIMEKGVYGKLRSVYPPISPAAWTTFATGYNPGKHGVYDFRDYDNTRYGCFADTIVDSNSFAGKTIWDLVGAAGQKVGVVTVPVTYPAWKVNGFMISGYPTPDQGKSFTYPAELGKTIPPLVGDAAFFKSASGHVLLKEMNRSMHECTDVSIDLMKKDDYGLFIMVVGATDRAHHDWWKYIDPEHPAYDAKEAALYGDLILEVYKAADACVGKFLEAIDDDTTVIVMSDHGGGSHPKYYLNSNYVLRTLNLLQPSVKASKKSGLKGAFKQFYRTKIRRFPYLEKVYRSLPQRLKKMATNLDSQTMMNLDAIDWKRTKAYRFPMYPPVEGIMINVVGRQPEGCVQQGEEYEAIRTRILEEMRSLRDPKTGEPIVLEAYRREELYHGERLETAPDLILVTQDQYKGGTGIDQLVSEVPLDVISKLSGVHRMNGIILAQGPHIRRNTYIEGAGIIDVAPTVMYALGMPIPTDMDGKPLAGLFDEAYMRQTEASYTDERKHEDVASDDYGYSEEEEESVRLKLEALGYL
ncbi:MAG TPA: alkaline phosphatase family protein [Ktedonobacteraceae bacterium]|nr:alkaline phosphatase family protein [Ktedonobacteraceae bacterium]